MCSILPAAPHPSIFHQLANICDTKRTWEKQQQYHFYSFNFSKFNFKTLALQSPYTISKSNTFRFLLANFRCFFFVRFVFFFKLNEKKEKKIMRWKRTTSKRCKKIKIKLTTRRFGKSTPPVLNDRELIQEWFNHLFPIINILVNVRFALTHLLTTRCLCVSARCQVAVNTSRERI